MYSPRRRNDGYVWNMFCGFVSVVLSLLLGLQMYAYFWGPSQTSLDSDISDMRYVVMQLTHSLTEVNRKHDRLQTDIEKITSSLPAVAAAGGHSRDALEHPARRHVRQELDTVQYDRQMVDYALESAGGRILDTGGTVDHVIYESPVSWALYALTAVMCSECLGARAIIRPESLPGDCWAFKGPRGQATIRLLGNVRIAAVSVEHIPANIAPTREISSAPRLIQLEGLEFRKDPYPHDFGTFEYEKSGKAIQYFAVLHPASKGFGIVRIRVHSNWGHPVYTCVYRIRVHGELDSRGFGSGDTELHVENE